MMTEDSNVQDGVTLIHLQKITAAERKKDEAVNALRSARKAAKADGVQLKALDAVRVLAKLDSHELTQDFNDIVRYARLLQVPLYSQFDMFDAPDGASDEEAIIARAASDGLRAGRLGETGTTTKYDPGSPAGQAWLEYWRKGQDELLSAIKEIPVSEKAPEEPKRPRGRPPGSGKKAKTPESPTDFDEDDDKVVPLRH